MEFFRIIGVNTTEEFIQEFLTLENLEKMSNQLFVVGAQNNEKASIGSVWGEFTLSRSVIKGGLRFALQECPNALVWSITTGFPPDEESVIIHLTINRQQKQKEFLEEVEEFLDDHSKCLELTLSNGLKQ